MKKTIVVFGLISGAISSGLMMATVPFHDQIGFDRTGYIVGYTTIVLSFLLVYFGVRSYRDKIAGGEITFVKAFGVGMAITVISCLCYVATWEIVYFNFMHDFMDKYGAHTIGKLRAAGASAAEIQAKTVAIQKYKTMYENPLINAAMTFIEPFPVGFVMTLISAGILRRSKPQGSALEAGLPMSSAS